MSLKEAILAGIQADGLEKPVLYMTMLLGLLIFPFFGVMAIFAALQSFSNGAGFLAALGAALLSLLLFGLAALCGHFIKKSVK